MTSVVEMFENFVGKLAIRSKLLLNFVEKSLSCTSQVPKIVRQNSL